MTRNDLILVAVLIIFSLVPPMNFDSKKKIAVVKVGGEIVRELDLSEKKIFTVEASGGKNILEVKGGAVRVVEADCPDKICVRRGAIKNLGETIACVPHKILIEVVGE
ncbi:MAG: NusG domain II-containing protein [Selenomonadaceae bacterium]|nr:NusG domain II-containing protein [Selenomonadaceae bacterium]